MPFVPRSFSASFACVRELSADSTDSDSSRTVRFVTDRAEFGLTVTPDAVSRLTAATAASRHRTGRDLSPRTPESSRDVTGPDERVVFPFSKRRAADQRARSGSSTGPGGQVAFDRRFRVFAPVGGESERRAINTMTRYKIRNRSLGSFGYRP